MKRKIRTLLGVATTAFILASCGGGSSSSISDEQTTTTTRTGIFTDDPVVGVCYSTSSGIVGQTGENGEFKYNVGDIVKFYVANDCKNPDNEVIIGSTYGQSTVTPIDLVADDTTNPEEIKEKVELITAFLYSISQKEDGKWKIDQEKALTLAQKLQLTDLENTSNSSQILQDLDVNTDEIYQHLNETLLEQVKEAINHMVGEELTLQTKSTTGTIEDTDTCQISNIQDTSNGLNITLNCKNNGDMNFSIYANEGLLYVSSENLDEDETVVNIDDGEICTTNHCLLATDQFAKDLYEETIAILKKLNGERVAFFDSESSGSSCTLVVNSQNPSQFKFVDCDNPEDNDDTWENLKLENGKVLAKDEDGAVTQILYVDPKDLKIFYTYEDNGNTYFGFLAPINQEESQMEETTPQEQLPTAEESYEDTEETSLIQKSVSIDDVFEGNFDTVYNALKDVQNKTDEQKLLFALSLLGKKINEDVLSKIGSQIVPGNDKVFEVTDPDEQIVDNLSYQDYTKMVEDVISDIQESINELQQISGQLSIKVPSFVYGEKTLYVDEPTVKTLVGLLYLKKALLEYALGYDASKLLEIENLEDISPLEALVNLSLQNSDTFQNAKDDVKNGLENIKEALQLISQMDQSALEESAVSLLLVDDEGELPTEEDINSAINYVDKAIESLNGEVSLTTPDGNTFHLNLGKLFSDPLNPALVKQDVDNGKTVDAEVCIGCYFSEQYPEDYYCYDDEEEILFTSDSYLYSYITGISPELAQELEERNINTITYYTISKYPEICDITVLYPEQ